MTALIILDRDGVLNRMRIDAEHGTVDSPLHPAHVEVMPGASEALAMLTTAGYRIAIASNQPAAAKGKTTLRNLQATHAEVIAQVQALGGRIHSSHLCFHRHEDGCSCRKPLPGLLEQALVTNPDCDKSLSWMVGDGVTDVQAGTVLGLRCAFLGPRKCDACKVLGDLDLTPAFWGTSLLDFVTFLLRGAKP